MARLHVPVQLRWSDFDAYGHVNNAEMVRLLEEARMEIFWAPDDPATASSTALLESGPDAVIQSFIARQTIEYLAQIPYMRAPVDVEVWIGRMGGAHIDISYEIYSPVGMAPRVLYTKAEATLVLVLAETGRPTRIWPELRAAWEPFMDERVRFSSRS